MGGNVEPQFIGAPKVPNGTGAAMKDVMTDYLSRYEVLDDEKLKLIGMSFDTTASNTGHKKGSAA